MKVSAAGLAVVCPVPQCDASVRPRAGLSPRAAGLVVQDFMLSHLRAGHTRAEVAAAIEHHELASFLGGPGLR